MIRVLLLALAPAVLAGCFSREPGAFEPGDDGHDDGLGPPPECSVDTDCVAAGPSCCSCPEYALPASSGWEQACEDIDCPTPPTGCPDQVARCDGGTCVLACRAITCAQSCGDGFVADDAGCLQCACLAIPSSAACRTASECAQAPADCCGCENGGADTAVPVADLADHYEGLNCPPNPTCPGVNVCVPGVAPRCDRGECVLDGGPRPLPANACGRPDLPLCPEGQTCVLNSDADATAEGVGICQ